MFLRQIHENQFELVNSSEIHGNVFENGEDLMAQVTYMDLDGYDSDKDPEFAPSPVPFSTENTSDELHETSESQMTNKM
ncbi:hypothetical protein FQA39_LY17982 [Lamprigera yunnana]|nr:hypothetical protein FQA39_LY17982 [Lamprigera yunnana]